ncbi:hypothetical protein [Paenibacillus mesotrionivorans]|uniref:Uncharacterized protein n=1 Tax=Paenibacillus mesotrionivorans TaxID=3160968 RepID=A0ACC7NWF4_9BACL
MIKLPNAKGWLTKEEAKATGLPLFIKTDSTKPGRWTQEPYGHAVLLTKTRCVALKMPTLDSGREAAVAYRYAQGASSSYRYVPLYDRTSVFESGELPYSILQDGEIMGNKI